MAGGCIHVALTCIQSWNGRVETDLRDHLVP